jgi:hypothetical protein
MSAGADGTEKWFDDAAKMQQVGINAMRKAPVQLMKVFNTRPLLGREYFRML